MLLYKRVADVDIYEKLFLKMSKIGFPDVYKGFKMEYYINDFLADLKIYPTDKKFLYI